MGNESSNNNVILDTEGKQIVRKCIIFVIPPGYEVNKMIDNFPQQFPYRYISIGQLIRHQINKKTKYSRIIIQTLQKNKKINKQLLSILLKTVALRGNFMIRYSVLDDDQLSVWKQFMSKVQVQMIVIIKPVTNINQQLQSHHNKKQQINNKLNHYYNDVKNVKTSFITKYIKQFNHNDDINTEIMNFIRKNNY